MAYFRFEPLQHLDDYKEFMNSWMNDCSVPAAVNPSFDIYTDEKSFFVEAEVPGFTKENIKLHLQENTLTISGEKKQENKEGVKYLRTERKYGSFKRTITFPEDINPNAVEAKYENGILKISVEKLTKPEFKERVINIK